METQIANEKENKNPDQSENLLFLVNIKTYDGTSKLI